MQEYDNESRLSHDQRNDRSDDYYDTLRLERLAHQRKVESLELLEREQSLLERRNREYSTHLMNLQAVEHYRLSFDQLLYVDPKEAQSISQLMDSPFLQGIKEALVAEIQRTVKKEERSASE